MFDWHSIDSGGLASLRRDRSTLLWLAALLAACGALVACSLDSATKRVESVESAQVVSLSVRLPNGLAPVDVALGAHESMHVGDGALVIEPDDTAAEVASDGSGLVTIGKTASVGSVTARGSVHVNGNTNAGTNVINVDGDVLAGERVLLGANASVSGNVTENASLSTRTFERSVTFPDGQFPDVRVASNQTRTLSPGNFGRVIIQKDGTLVLEAGVYFLETLELDAGGTVVMKNATSAVTLYVKERISYRGRFQEEATGELIGNVFVGTPTPTTIQLSAPFIGTLVAPHATIVVDAVSTPTGCRPKPRTTKRFGRSEATPGCGVGSHQGAFFAQRVEVRPSAVVTHRAFPSTLITGVTVSKTTVCENEPVLVEVRTQSLSGSTTDTQPQVTINGLPGTRRYVQYFGTGTRLILIHAVQEGVAETRTIAVEVIACATKFPDLVVTPSLVPYEVEFTVANQGDFTGANRRFVWQFGDGQTAESPYPYITHTYADAIDASTAVLQFEATLTISQDAMADASVKKTVTVANMYAKMAMRGTVHPPVESTHRLSRVGKALQGSFTVRNVENDPIHFTEKRIERHSCDPDRDPELGAAEALNVEVPGSGTYEHEILLPFVEYGRDVCAVSVHLTGTTTDGLTVQASGHLETPSPSPLETEAPAEVSALMNEIAAQGLSADPNRIALTDVRRLALERRIAAMPPIDDLFPLAQQTSDEVIGQRCDPEQQPPIPGVACEATEDWTITPPLIRNAQKGDLIIVTACETVGGLLRVVVPPQAYTHEGIMTRNYFGIAHSTFAAGQVLNSVSLSDLDEDLLRFASPGALNESINTAFGTFPFIDRDTNWFEPLQSFYPEPQRCLGDQAAFPPLVIRPPVGSHPNVRRRLRAAADLAAPQRAHYRWFGFSRGNIAFDECGNYKRSGNECNGDFRDPNGEPATVSTSFLWWTLKRLEQVEPGIQGTITLEGDELEDYFRDNPVTGNLHEEQDVQPPTGEGITDGLYHYTKSERKKGAEFVFNTTRGMLVRMRDAIARDKAGAVLGPALVDLVELFSDQADDIAEQFTRCFAFDECGEVTDSDFPFDPGIGEAVSPDQFLNWDLPNTDGVGLSGGALGDFEEARYISGEARRIFRWAAAEGTGCVHGKVTFQDGTEVQEAFVTAGGLEGSTDGNGDYRLCPLRGGIQHLVEARKEEDSRLLFDARAFFLDPDEDEEVNLVLTLEGPTPPPFDVVERVVPLSGNLHVFDDESIGESPSIDLPISADCVVAPVDTGTSKRNVRKTIQDLSRTSCSDIQGADRVRCFQENPSGVITIPGEPGTTIDCDDLPPEFILGCKQEHLGGVILVPTTVEIFCTELSPANADACAFLVEPDSFTVPGEPGTEVHCDDINNPVFRAWCRDVHPSGSFTSVAGVRLSCEELPEGIISFYPQCVDLTATVRNNPCVGDEVVANVEVFCELLEDNETVRVTAGVFVLESTDCDGSEGIFDDAEEDSSGGGPIDIPPGPACTDCCLSVEEEPLACKLPLSGQDLRASVEGGDYADLDLDLGGNFEGETITINPILPENRRRVSFVGDVFINDDEFGESPETDTFTFDERCQVDPLARTDSVHWSECEGNEVRVEIDITCTLAPDNLSVNIVTHVRLFDQTECENVDEDGDEDRTKLFGPDESAFLNAPEEGNVLKITNEDEGGDFADIEVFVSNDVQ